MVYHMQNTKRNIDKIETLGVSFIFEIIEQITHPTLIIQVADPAFETSPTEAKYNPVTMEFAQEEG